MRTYPLTAVVSSDDVALALALCARRTRALLLVHTGAGKGKSTPAFGLALRGWNQGWSAGVFQFVKSGKWRTGEQTAFETVAGVHEQSGTGGPIEWPTMGSGRPWSRLAGNEADHAAETAEGWAEIKRRSAETHEWYVLDEVAKAQHPMDAGQKGQRGIEW